MPDLPWNIKGGLDRANRFWPGLCLIPFQGQTNAARNCAFPLSFRQMAFPKFNSVFYPPFGIGSHT